MGTGSQVCVCLVCILSGATPTGQDAIEGCIRREVALTAGHIEFHFQAKNSDDQSILDEGEYYAEWSSTNKIRIGLLNDSQPPIVKCDGSFFTTSDDWSWPLEYLTDFALPDDVLNRLSADEVDSLHRARRLYFAIFCEFLKPLSMGDSLDTNVSGQINVYSLVFESKEIESKGDVVVEIVPRAVFGVSPAVISRRFYGVDTSRDLPLSKWVSIESEKPTPAISWTGPVEIEKGIWLPGGMHGWDWTSGYADQSVLNSVLLSADHSRLGHVDESRFSLAGVPLDSRVQIESELPFRELIYRALDWMEDDVLGKVSHPSLLGFIFVLGGLLWLRYRRKKRLTILRSDEFDSERDTKEQGTENT